MSARIASSAVALAGLALLAACGSKVPRYYISAQQHEAVPDKVDGQWFTREIVLQNKLDGIELVYCPILLEAQNGEVTVCRTAIVWEANHSRLTDAPSDADKANDAAKAQPAADPTPAAPEAATPEVAPSAATPPASN